MKSVLFIHTGEQCYESMECFIDEMDRVCSERGMTTGHLRGDSFENWGKNIEAKPEFDIVFGFNSPFFCRKNDRGYIVNQLGKTIYYYMLDHPMYHHEVLSCDIENFHVLCLDENHANYIEHYYKNLVGKTQTVPIPSVEGDKEGVKPFRERTKSLVFTGTYTEPLGLQKKAMSMQKPFSDIFHASVEELLEHPAFTVEDVVLRVTKEVSGWDPEKIETNFSQILQANFLIDFYLRALLREMMIYEIIKDQIPVELYGHGWDVFRDKWQLIQPGVIDFLRIQGQISYVSLPQIYGDTRISLNQLPGFKRGCHDRIPLSMRNGAVAMTDLNKYLTGQMMIQDGVHVLAYDLEKMDEIPEKIRRAQSDEDLLENISREAVCFAKKNMTWESFIEKIWGQR